MVKRRMYRKIQKLKNSGYGKAKIAEMLEMDPATVRKYYSMDLKSYNRYRSEMEERKKIFEDFREEIIAVYRENNFRKLNMSAVYDYLEEKFENLPGNEQTLRNYIGYLIHRGQLRLEPGNRCYSKVAPLAYGKQMQIDFGEYKTRSGLKLYIFGAVLSASRYKYIAMQGVPFTTLDLISHVLDCFDYLGGIPEELVIDQDSVMVVSENYGDIIYTRKFSYFIREMGLKMYVCRKSDPESKGKVENVIKYVKYNFLSIRDFTSIEEANESLSKWLRRRGNGKISQATKMIPRLAFEEERQYLRSLKNSIFRKHTLLGREDRTVSDKGFITVDAIEYSVPSEYRNQQVEIFKTETELYVFNRKTGKEIAFHKIPLIPGKRIIKSEHFREKTRKLTDLRKKAFSLYNFPGWNEFIKLNIKSYSRYVRDQLMYAFKHLQEVEDEEALEKAVAYCLENKTYSMIQLKDTYHYQLRQCKQDKKAINPDIKVFSEKITYPDPEVATRKLEEYEHLLSPLQGGLR